MLNWVAEQNEISGVITAAVEKDMRNHLLRFCRWLCKDEFGEGREEEIVDNYLREGP